MGEQVSTSYIYIIAILFLFNGVIASLANKTLFQKTGFAYECTNNDIDPKHTFTKPYFLVMTMFIGEAMCLPVYYILQYLEKRKKQQRADGLLTDPLRDGVDSIAIGGDDDDNNGVINNNSNSRPPKQAPVYYFYLLSLFDLCATSAVTVALKWIDASIGQMLRGSMVVFTAVFTLIFLNRRYTLQQWGGVLIVVVGLIVVGAATLLKGSGNNPASTTQVIAGLLLTVLGSALNALQNVFEEKLLKADNYEVHPLQVVGWEGMSGLFNSALIVLPLLQHIDGDDCGVQEDTLDSLFMISKSWLVILLNLAYIFGIMIMNYTANTLSLHLSATHRNLINSTRTVFVWVFSLLLYYKVDKALGEDWNNYSLVELAGFVLLIAGTFYYSWASQQAAKQQLIHAKLEAEFSQSGQHFDSQGQVQA